MIWMQADHVNPLDRDTGIDDNPLSGLQDPDGLLGATILFCNQGADIRLDASSAKPNDNLSKYRYQRSSWELSQGA